METVVIAMSGGVDSSVAALLLKQQGYRVIGLFMKNWEEKDGNGACTAEQDFADVVRVCEHIDIPYYSVNFVREYWDSVFTHFLREFKMGHTPNPDILCNREIKFKVLLEKAISLGADYLATGHYCQNIFQENQNLLVKGNDPGKDQTYFLYTIQQKALNKVLFPVGHMLKQDLRQYAERHGLATFAKKDSTGICFIGKRNFKDFLGQHIAYTPGDFEDLSGNKVGRHDGVAYYTPGQRKGMGIGGPGDAWFVVGKDIERNVVILAQGTRHPALYCDELTATEISWISGSPPANMACKSKVRYRQPDQDCLITKLENDVIHVRFKVPQRAVTPRQSIVFYDGNVCLGGAIIQNPGPSYYDRKLSLPEIVSP